ncbi:MAG: O-antigen ligase family protein [Anaerolinea sp.]|nr:O-antigen ligase family protein [Anaerolinea sp.]
MQTTQKRSFNLIPHKLSAWRWLLLLLAILTGSLVSLLSQQVLLVMLVLLVGLPLAGLVISQHTRQTAVVLLLALVPLVGILKALTGSRFAPLTFDLGLLLALALFVLADLLRGKIRIGHLDMLWLAFLILAFLQMFNPNVPTLQAGVEGFRKFAFMSIAFYMGRHMLREKDRRLLVHLLLLVSVPVTLYGLKQFFFISALDLRVIDLATSGVTTYLMGGWIRPFSTTPGPFHLGLYLLTVLLLLIALLIDKQTKPRFRLVLTGVIALQLTVLIMTRTKGNWIGLIIGVIVLALLQVRHSPKAFIRLFGLILLGALVIGAIVLAASDIAQSVVQDAIFAVTHPAQAPTFIYRLSLWQDTMLPAISRHPLLGYGTSSAGEGLANLYQNNASLYFPSHNLYLKVFLELGLFGLLIFLTIIMLSLRRGWRLRKRQGEFNPTDRIIWQWSFAVIVAFLVAGIVIPTLDAYPPNYYFWLLLGIFSSGWVSKAKT